MFLGLAAQPHRTRPIALASRTARGKVTADCGVERDRAERDKRDGQAVEDEVMDAPLGHGGVGVGPGIERSDQPGKASEAHPETRQWP